MADNTKYICYYYSVLIILKEMRKRNLKEWPSPHPGTFFSVSSSDHSLKSPPLNFLTGISVPDQKSHWGFKVQRQHSWY